MTIEGRIKAVGEAKPALKDRAAVEQREYANHLYDGFADDRLGVCLSFRSKRKRNATPRILELAGCLLRQNNDTEGCFTFDPTNAEQVQAVTMTVAPFMVRFGLVFVGCARRGDAQSVLSSCFRRADHEWEKIHEGVG